MDNGFPVPQGVQTSVTYPELRLLQKYAHEAKIVLEIGTLYGFSCIGMALAGAHVTSVDPHYEGRDPRKPDTWEEFLRNCQRHGFGEHFQFIGDSTANLIANTRVQILTRRQSVEDWEDWQQACGRMSECVTDSVGLVFVDGNHIWPCPRRDILIGLRHLRAPGYIAVHDVTPNWGGVWRAVHEFTEGGELVALEQVGTLAVYQARDVAVPPTS